MLAMRFSARACCSAAHALDTTEVDRSGRVVGYGGHGRSRLGGRDRSLGTGCVVRWLRGGDHPGEDDEGDRDRCDGREDVLLQPDRAHRPHQGRSAQRQSECGQASGDTIAQLHRLRRLEAVDEGDATPRRDEPHDQQGAVAEHAASRHALGRPDDGPRPPSELEGGSGGERDSGLRGVAMHPDSNGVDGAGAERGHGGHVEPTCPEPSRVLLGRRVDADYRGCCVDHGVFPLGTAAYACAAPGSGLRLTASGHDQSWERTGRQPRRRSRRRRHGSVQGTAPRPHAPGPRGQRRARPNRPPLPSSRPRT